MLRRVACTIALSVFALAVMRVPASAGEPSIVEFGPTFRTAVTGIAIGRDGTIWVGEDDGIVRLSRSGDVLQVRRADDCYYCGGDEIAIDGYGVWQNGSDRVLRFAGSGLQPFDAIHNDCGWRGVRGFAATADALYTSRQDERGLRRIDSRGAETRLLPALSGIEAIAAAPDGSLWLGIASDPQCGDAPIVSLARYSGTGSFNVVNVAGLSRYRLLGDFAVTPDGSLVVVANNAGASGQNNTATHILKIATDGTLSDLAHISQPPWASGIGGIATANDGSIWFTQPATNRIGRIDAAGVVTEFRAGIPTGASPRSIAADRDGSVWFTDSTLNTVEHMDADGAVRVYGNLLAPINIPGGPVVTSDGALWFRETLSWHPRIARIGHDGKLQEFMDSQFFPSATLEADGNGVVLSGQTIDGHDIANRVSASGTVSAFDPSGCLFTQSNIACFASPHGRGKLSVAHAEPGWAVRAPDGNLWFTDIANSQIGRIDKRGAVALFTRGLTHANSGPQYLTVGPDGALWFTEIRDRVGRITLDGHIREFSAGIPHRSSLGGIVAGRDGNLWFTLYHGNELARITPSGVVTRFRRGIYPSRGSDDAVGDSIPFVDAAGRIWFNEPQGGRIAVATLPN